MLYEVMRSPEFHVKNEIPVFMSYQIVAIRKIVAYLSDAHMRQRSRILLSHALLYVHVAFAECIAAKINFFPLFFFFLKKISRRK